MTIKKSEAAIAWFKEADPDFPTTEEEYEALKAELAAAEAESRHLSARVPHPLYAQLEQLAMERGETVSQVARTLIIEGLARQQNPDRDALDAAIAALQKLRREMPAVAESKPARPQRKKAS
jgi:multidrug efflux pump subunit AcrA (membrane-fusion protein)